jgi:uncharacterized repeat protein (TIGR02543 family)
VPARSGYTFDGWYDSDGFSNPAITAIPQGSAEDKDFYADWSLDTYDIHYELYEGKNHDNNPKTYTINGLPITLLDPTHAAREFRGWYTDPGFKEADVVTEIPAGSTGPKTFYAKWDPGVLVEMILQSKPNDPALSDVPIFEDEPVQFTAAGAGYESWQWRWDGEIIEGAESDTYILTEDLKIPGVYELSVKVIIEGGQTLSARCRVTIKAKEGGAK